MFEVCIITFVVAELCNGSTADSDSVCLGSNPSSAAKKTDKLQLVGFFIRCENNGISSTVGCIFPNDNIHGIDAIIVKLTDVLSINII